MSEVLDFCAEIEYSVEKASRAAQAIQNNIEKRYGLRVRVGPPKAREGQYIRIFRSWIRVETEPARSDVPWQRIKLEIANVPSSSNEPRTLSRNYDVIPHGYEDTVIRVETREGILADKLVSFPATLATYLRWRDIWDMRRLRKRGVSVETALFRSKVEHCRIEEFSELLAAAIEKLPELVTSGEIAAALNEFWNRIRPNALSKAAIGWMPLPSNAGNC